MYKFQIIKTLFFSVLAVSVFVLGFSGLFKKSVGSLPDCDVYVSTSDDLGALADANPENTVFCIEAGVHYETSVLPKSGQQFIGDYGAVLSGARVLNAVDAIDDSGVGTGPWYWEDQTQEGYVHGSLESGGNPMDRNPEDIFVDDTTWLEQVDSLGSLDQSGEWYFDYSADRIYLYDNPSSFSLIETSVEEFAIAPVWWMYGGDVSEFPDDVVIQNLVIEKYANPAQFGAIGAQSYEAGGNGSDSWHMSNIEARYNHGCGIRIFNGSTLENSYSHHNGQIGVCGSGQTAETQLPMTMRDTEISYNKILDYNWGWEGGATKFSLTDGMIVENNWVHNNHGPGIWFDIDNFNTIIRSNLVEDNDLTGIFYEISYGDTDIYWNIVRNNGIEPFHDDFIPNESSLGDVGAGVEVSNSDGDTGSGSGYVEIYENAIYDNRWGIFAHDEGVDADGLSDPANRINASNEPINLGNYWVHDNEVKAEQTDRWVHHVRIDDGSAPNVLIDNNTYFVSDPLDTFWLSNLNNGSTNHNAFAAWQALDWDLNGTTVPYSGTPSLPSGATAFTASTYGPQDTNPTVNINSHSDGATISDTVAIAASADDDFAIDRVEFTFDGSIIATDTSAPFSFDLNTELYSDNSYPLQAEVFDSLGNSSTDSITLNILNADVTNPSVNITSPSQGSTVSNTVTFSASASDNEALDRVELRLGSSLLKSDSSSPYSVAINTKDYANGSKTLRATAFDEAGNSASDTITVTFSNPVENEQEQDEADSNDSPNQSSNNQSTNQNESSNDSDADESETEVQEESENEDTQEEANNTAEETQPPTQNFGNTDNRQSTINSTETEEDNTEFLGIELTPPVIISLTSIPVVLGGLGFVIRKILFSM